MSIGIIPDHQTVSRVSRLSSGWTRLVAGVCLLVAAGCSVRRAPEAMSHTPPCLAEEGTAVEQETIAWVLRESADERSALDAWCWAVGPAVLAEGMTRSAGSRVDSLPVITWNAEVGIGRLDRLVADIRSGELLGKPVNDFVLLLQEVHRAGDAVPARIPAWAAAPRRVGDPALSWRVDVVEFAQREGLHLMYAPSMRNGTTSDGGPAEDRGNAILSTLPLRAPAILELPYERQRRVAVLATVAGETTTGEAWSLRLASVHLDNRARFGRIHRSFGAARLRQAQSVATHLADAGAAVVGGDLNTWEAGENAAAVRFLRASFPLPHDPPDDDTHLLPWMLPGMQLDHMFFRLPAGWDADYRVVKWSYGSDHRPLAGWVYIGGS